MTNKPNFDVTAKLRIRDLEDFNLKELAQRDVIRAPGFVIAELQALFEQYNIEFEGRFEPQLSETPYKRLVPRLDVQFEPSNEDTLDSRIGGVPNRSWDNKEWPLCTGCQRPMHFIGQLLGPFSVDRITIGKHEAIQLYACFYEDTECLSWLPFCGANQAKLVTDLEASTRESSAPAFPPYVLQVDDGWDDAIVGAPSIEEEQFDDYMEAFDHAAHDKIGGVSLFPDSEDTPVCPVCSKSMALLAQFISDVVPNPLGDGVCMVYICPEKHLAGMEYSNE